MFYHFQMRSVVKTIRYMRCSGNKPPIRYDIQEVWIVLVDGNGALGVLVHKGIIKEEKQWDKKTENP